jgi:hypothetical protein
LSFFSVFVIKGAKVMIFRELWKSLQDKRIIIFESSLSDAEVIGKAVRRKNV